MGGLIDLVGYPPQTRRSPSFGGGSWRNNYVPMGRYKIRGGSEKDMGSSQYAPKVFTMENRKYTEYGIKFNVKYFTSYDVMLKSIPVPEH